jgi:hypothetical protein
LERPSSLAVWRPSVTSLLQFCNSAILQFCNPIAPLTFQEQLFDAVRMKEIVQGKVAEHDEDRIVAVFAVFGSSIPIVGFERFEPRHQPAAIVFVSP